MDTQINEQMIGERDKKIKISVGTLNKFDRTNRYVTFFYIL